MTTYLGIDPGLTGGFGVITEERVYVALIPTLWVVKNEKRRNQYNELAIRAFLRKHLDSVVSLEEQFPMPFERELKDGSVVKQGAVSSFSTGCGYCLFRGMLCALDITTHKIHPKSWQKEFFKRDTAKTTKEQALEAVKELYPTVDLYRSARAKKPDHNLVDALLIAEWCKRKHEGTLKK